MASCELGSGLLCDSEHLGGRHGIHWESGGYLLSKCANPSCTTAFNYFNEGKLFEFDLDPVSGICLHPLKVKRPAPSRELFWLCGPCSANFTLQVREHGEVVPVRLTEERRRRVA